MTKDRRKEIIEEMIIVWGDEKSGCLDYILERATAIKDDNLVELVKKAKGFLKELESIEDEIDDIMLDYEDELEEEWKKEMMEKWHQKKSKK